MARTESFTRYFTNIDVVDIRFRLEGNRIVAFRINYRAHILDGWHEVIRYDNAHRNPLHVHRFWPPHSGRKEYIDPEVRRDYTQAVNDALADLKANWFLYRRRVEEGIRRGL